MHARLPYTHHSNCRPAKPHHTRTSRGHPLTSSLCADTFFDALLSVCWQVTENHGRGRRPDGVALNIEKIHFLNGVSTRSCPCTSSSSSSRALRRCKNEEPKFEHVFEPHCLSRDMLVLCAPVKVHVQPHPSRRSSFEYNPGICVLVGTS